MEIQLKSMTMVYRYEDNFFNKEGKKGENKKGIVMHYANQHSPPGRKEPCSASSKFPSSPAIGSWMVINFVPSKKVPST